MQADYQALILIQITLSEISDIILKKGSKIKNFTSFYDISVCNGPKIHYVDKVGYLAHTQGQKQAVKCTS